MVSAFVVGIVVLIVLLFFIGVVFGILFFILRPPSTSSAPTIIPATSIPLTGGSPSLNFEGPIIIKNGCDTQPSCEESSIHSETEKFTGCSQSLSCKDVSKHLEFTDSLEKICKESRSFEQLNVSLVPINLPSGVRIRDIVQWTSKWLLALTTQGRDIVLVIRNDGSGKHYERRSSLNLDRIVVFNCDIFGLSGGRLFILDASPKEPSGFGAWSPIDLPIRLIIWISISLDGQWMWINNNTTGVLLNCNLRKVTEDGAWRSTIQRVLGVNRRFFLDLNTSTHEMIVYPWKKKYISVAAAAFDACNDIIYVTTGQSSSVRGIRIINGQAYYLLA